MDKANVVIGRCNIEKGMRRFSQLQTLTQVFQRPDRIIKRPVDQPQGIQNKSLLELVFQFPGDFQSLSLKPEGLLVVALKPMGIGLI